jgi:hypothetical protein
VTAALEAVEQNQKLNTLPAKTTAWRDAISHQTPSHFFKRQNNDVN